MYIYITNICNIIICSAHAQFVWPKNDEFWNWSLPCPRNDTFVWCILTGIARYPCKDSFGIVSIYKDGNHQMNFVVFEREKCLRVSAILLFYHIVCKYDKIFIYVNVSLCIFIYKHICILYIFYIYIYIHMYHVCTSLYMRHDNCIYLYMRR